MIKTIRFSTVLLLTLTYIQNAYPAGSAILELIEILRNKGSITTDEYLSLRNAAMADNKSAGVDREAAREPTGPDSQTDDPAAWASRVSVKGDIRLRYQGQDNDPGEGRSRGRVRYRLGVIARPSAGLEAGAGLASGSSDLRSTNQTFTDTFSSKGINLDYAYAQYRFNDSVRAIGGKFKFAGYLYTASDLLWDGDINPEGASVNFSRNSEAGNTFANSGIWVLEENSSDSDDPYLVYAQLGQNFGNDLLFGTIAASYFSFEDNSAPGSFRTDGSNSDFRFGGILNLSGEIGINTLFDDRVKASLFADWVSNSDTDSSEDNGYLVGIKASSGPWSLSYSYANLDQNAWPDILPDSDRFDGLTGIRGHEIALSWSLMRNVAIGIDYYMTKSSLLNEDQDLLQLDLNVRF